MEPDDFIHKIGKLHPVDVYGVPGALGASARAKIKSLGSLTCKSQRTDQMQFFLHYSYGSLQIIRDISLFVC